MAPLGYSSRPNGLKAPVSIICTVGAEGSATALRVTAGVKTVLSESNTSKPYVGADVVTHPGPVGTVDSDSRPY